MKFILASGSPRRKELLKLLVPEYEIIVSGIDEKLEDEQTPSEQVIRLAYTKAKDVFNKTTGNRIVIGSDTVVARNGIIYGKPKDKVDAKRMIKEFLEGDRTHSIMTGLAVLIEKDGKYEEYKTFDEAKIFLKDMTDKQIDWWLDTEKWTDKAGAYAIQEEFGAFVNKIEGNYQTIVGLPIHKLYDIIEEYIN
ncbi:MAG: septum formation protein Maf [Clostridia bacterium]|nr:septum formation protein Maf [Clostridia bacterium]